MPASRHEVTLLAAALALAACGGSAKQTGPGGGTSSSSSSTSSTSSASSSTTSTSSSTGTSSSSGGSSSSTSSSTSSGAVSFPFPHVVYGGGTTLGAPSVITITFSGNTYATDLDAFGASFAGSSYWAAVTSDLTCGSASACVGPGPAGTAAVSPVAIGSSYVDSAGGGGGNTLQPYLQSVIAALPSSMQPATDNLYVFYIPSSTTIDLDGAQGCTSFGGYHNSMTIGATPVVYAVVLDCGGREALTAEQTVTFAASHEIAEASSDSIVSTAALPSGYAIDETVQGSYPWLTLGLSEIGDLCVDFLSLGEDVTTENGFTVQRIWSPADAATGTMDPCVPSNGEVYFNGFPTVSAVIVDVGQSQSFEIDALALGSEPTWTLAVEDATIPGQTDQYLSFSMAGGNNQKGVGVVAAQSGDRFQATVTMLKDPATAPNSEGWGLGLVVSYAGLDPQTSTAGHYWPFIVLTSAKASQFGITMTEAQPPHLARRLSRRPYPRVPRSRFLDPLLPLFR